MSNLPTVNPLASYPLKNIVGRTDTHDMLRANYLDPRGPIFINHGAERRPACAGIDSRTIMNYEKARSQAFRNRSGQGYAASVMTSSGRTVQVTGRDAKLPGAILSSAAGKKAVGSTGPGNEIAQAAGFAGLFKRLI